MSEADVGQELEAIKQIVEALEPLTPDGRDRVINYVFQTLDMSTNALPSSSAPPSSAAASPSPQEVPTPPIQQSSTRVVSDIRSFKEQKQPKSASEMAAVLAYYLAELAPQDSRKLEITASDIDKYFKQAGFPLPAAAKYTLQNAKNAGYLDSGSERGGFKVNPVGHNLVAHNLPASDTSGASGSTKPRRKKVAKPKQRKQPASKKKAVKKKSSRK